MGHLGGLVGASFHDHRVGIAVVKHPLGEAGARLFMLNLKQGAAVSLYLATSPDVAQVSGEYFVKSRPARSNPLSRDPKVMAEVWLCTGIMTGLPLA